MDIEKVSCYPRPPKLEESGEEIIVKALGEILIKTTKSIRILETNHPPTYYFPSEILNHSLLTKSLARNTYCEWKGIAEYYHLVNGEKIIQNALWRYNNPKERFKKIKGWYGIYPSKMDACYLSGEKVTSQYGGFYGGWITKRIVGPFKGDPGHPGII